MRELTAIDVVALAERYPKCETTRNALQRAKRMVNPAFVQFDGARCEVDVVERKDMGLVDDTKNVFETSIKALEARKDVLLAEIEQAQEELKGIDALLAQYGGKPVKAAKKRGRPVGAKNKKTAAPEAG